VVADSRLAVAASSEVDPSFVGSIASLAEEASMVVTIEETDLTLPSDPYVATTIVLKHAFRVVVPMVITLLLERVGKVQSELMLEASQQKKLVESGPKFQIHCE